jgi:hypothetical protein
MLIYFAGIKLFLTIYIIFVKDAFYYLLLVMNKTIEVKDLDGIVFLARIEYFLSPTYRSKDFNF